MFIKLIGAPQTMNDAAPRERWTRWVVVSLGGSLIAPPEGIAVGFLREFSALIRDLVDEGFRFVLITGGGKTARDYQKAAAVLCSVPADDLDWLGIHATRLNAHLIRTIFRDEACPRIITNPLDDPLPSAEEFAIVVGAGWRPGWSTDYDAAVLAKRIGARQIVNLSNVAYVYDADPQYHPEAHRFTAMTWQDLRAIIGEEWSPGLNVPFDPVAAKLCQESGIEAAILSADDLANVRKALLGKEFQGTLVK